MVAVIAIATAGADGWIKVVVVPSVLTVGAIVVDWLGWTKVDVLESVELNAIAVLITSDGDTSAAELANVESVGIMASAFDTVAAISETVFDNVVKVIGIVIVGAGDTTEVAAPKHSERVIYWFTSVGGTVVVTCGPIITIVANVGTVAATLLRRHLLAL